VGGREAVLVTIASCEPGAEAPGPGAARVVQAEHLDEGPLASISPRERVVLSLIGAGMPTAEIARKLGRSTKTIENQRLSLGRKLGARNRVELARIALQSGLAAKVANKKLSMG
jgi:DNA-binding NarL/FixJ family response regulator